MVDHYISQEKKKALLLELDMLKTTRIPDLAKRIDEARQLGDLSENAEYHAAREDMAWAHTRIKDIQRILDTSEIVVEGSGKRSAVALGSTITVKVNGKEKSFTLVGAVEANPAEGKISNESPLGSAFFGKKPGDKVEVTVPAGVLVYEIISIT